MDNAALYTRRIALDRVPGVGRNIKYGRNTDVDTSAEEDVWIAGGTYSYLTTGELLSIVSTSTEDTNVGTGGRLCIVQGLDEDFEEIEELIMLTGTTPVVTTKKFFRNFRIAVLTAGATKRNVGTITTTGVDSGFKQAQINPLVAQTEQTHFTVPAGKTLLLLSVTAGVSKSDSAELYIDIRDNTFGPDSTFRRQYTAILTESTVQIRLESQSITEKTDIRLRAKAISNNTKVTASYEYDLVTDKAVY